KAIGAGRGGSARQVGGQRVVVGNEDNRFYRRALRVARTPCFKKPREPPASSGVRQHRDRRESTLSSLSVLGYYQENGSARCKSGGSHARPVCVLDAPPSRCPDRGREHPPGAGSTSRGRLGSISGKRRGQTAAHGATTRPGRRTTRGGRSRPRAR